MASFQDDEIAHDILALLGETPASTSSRGGRSRSERSDDIDDSSRRRSRRARRSRNDSNDDDDDSDVNGGRGPVDDDDDRDPWGPDLIGDSRDRAYLDSLPELEREKILADRAEQRQRREERRAVAEKLREQLSQRPTRRSESNSAAADKKRKLQALKEKRASRRSNRYSDSDSDYNEDRPSTRKRHRRDNDRDDDDDDYDIDVVSDTDGRDSRRSSSRQNDRHHDRSHRRDRSNSPAYDPAYSPTRSGNDRSSSPRRSMHPRDPPLTLAELNGMMLTRTQIAKYCYADFFEDLARDAFVRLRVGDNSGEPVYRVCQIVDVTEYKRPYAVQTVRTNKSFLLKHGSAEKVFLADIFSNTPFTQAEFDRWRLTCESESIPLPTKADAYHKAKDIAQAEAHIFTDEEILLMVKKKMQLPGAVPRNFAAEKSVLIKKLQLAKANGDRDAVEDISNQLREIDATVEAKVFGSDDNNSTAAFARRREGGDSMLASAMGGKNIFKNPGLLERKRPTGAATTGAGTGAGAGTLTDIPGLTFALAGPPLPDLNAADDDDEGDGGVLDLYKSAPKLDLDL